MTENGGSANTFILLYAHFQANTQLATTIIFMDKILHLFQKVCTPTTKLNIVVL